MAEAVTTATPAPAGDPAPALPPGGEPAAAGERPRYAARFRAFSAGLVVVAVGVIALAFVLAADSGDGTSHGRAWASFAPTTGDVSGGAQQIADYVAPRYRLPNGQQIVAVTGGPMELQNLPMRIAVRQTVGQGGDIKLIDGKGVLYRMCGLGPACSIATGKPSVQRSLLLYREALELALYSFHDLKGVDNVVVFIPPRKGQRPSVALLFQHGEVAGQLARPLQTTLRPPVPNPDTIAAAPDTPFVQRLTLGNIFQFSLTEANQDASIFLVLDPLRTS